MYSITLESISFSLDFKNKTLSFVNSQPLVVKNSNVSDAFNSLFCIRINLKCNVTASFSFYIK